MRLPGEQGIVGDSEQPLCGNIYLAVSWFAFPLIHLAQKMFHHFVLAVKKCLCCALSRFVILLKTLETYFRQGYFSMRS